jgi:metal-sulfur cluster biosynthetic enzyme
VNSVIRAALDRVVDPCSAAMDVPLGLAEMGLVASIADDGHGTVDVVLQMTSPCCAYGPRLADAARRELERLPGVVHAAVTIDHTAEWTPADMAPRALSRLAVRRRDTRRSTGITPYDWSSR